MKLLITGANCLLARSMADSLQADPLQRDVVSLGVDTTFATPFGGDSQLQGDLRDPAFVAQAVDGVDAILHLAPLSTRLAAETDTLDHATRGTYQLAVAAAEAGVQRFVLGSTLDLFKAVWARYLVNESWRPRPQPQLDQLCAYLAEVSVREVARSTGLAATCLRLGEVVDDQAAGAAAYDRRWLHVDDAVWAVRRALESDAAGWRIYHIPAAGERTWVPVSQAVEEPFSYQPQHDFRARWSSERQSVPKAIPAPIPTRPIRKVVVFGAGGPLAAALADELRDDYELRLTDLRSAEEAAGADAQSPGAPLPTPPQPPHEWAQVDVRDSAQVLDACEGADAIINLSVLRNETADAFRVNTLGAYHVVQAAVKHGIKRVVHTGPFMLGQQGAAGYNWDDFVVDDVPARPGIDWVYFQSKLLGQETCRIFAEHFGLEVPTLTFAQFANPDQLPERLASFAVSWQDAARAIRRALEVETLPSPYEYFHICTDLPHGVFPNQKAKRLLGWQPRDLFEEFYVREG